MDMQSLLVLQKREAQSHLLSQSHCIPQKPTTSILMANIRYMYEKPTIDLSKPYLCTRKPKYYKNYEK